MKKFILVAWLTIPASAFAATTINATNAYGYGANVGWVNARADVTNGLVVGEYFCRGYLWGANIGYVNLGNGAPANGIQYANASGTDFGVNVTGHYITGGVVRAKLRGYAYGANIGWINFENTGNPEVVLTTGRLSGFAYSANCGWLSLGDGSFFVQTDTIAPAPDTDGDGIADAWERLQTGNLTTLNASGDADGDGASNFAEYEADTAAVDVNDSFRIVVHAPAPDGLSVSLTWTSRPTRLYRLQTTTDLLSPFATVLDNIVPDGATTTRVLSVTPGEPMRFYRVQVFRPLAP